MSETATLEPPAQVHRRPLRGPTTVTTPTEIVPQGTRETPKKPTGITDKTWNRLIPLRQAFVAAYVKDGNALSAYLAAGYVTENHGKEREYLKRRAYSVIKGKTVSQALLEYRDRRDALAEARKDFALDWIVSEHERLMQVAESKGDLAVATRNLELIGRTRGVYADNVMIDVGQRREYSEAERVEAARLSRMLLTEGDSGESKALEGDSVQDSDDSSQDEDGDHGAAARS